MSYFVLPVVTWKKLLPAKLCIFSLFVPNEHRQFYFTWHRFNEVVIKKLFVGGEGTTMSGNPHKATLITGHFLEWQSHRLHPSCHWPHNRGNGVILFVCPAFATYGGRPMPNSQYIPHIRRVGNIRECKDAREHSQQTCITCIFQVFQVSCLKWLHVSVCTNL